MPGMYQAPSGQLGRIKNPQPYFSSNIGMLAGVGPMGFNPANLFANGEQGGWYDPSDFTTLFQDSAGTTPVTAGGQPVGMMLDKHQGLNRGPELCPQTSGTAGFTTSNSSVSSDGTLITVTSAGLSGVAVASFPTVIGQWYEYSGTCVGGTGTQKQMRMGSTSGGFDYGNPVGAGSFRFIFKATTTTAFLTLFSGDTAGMTGIYGPISTKSVGGASGNHLTQATTTKRPLLQQDAGGLYYLNFDGVDDELDGSGWTAFSQATMAVAAKCNNVNTVFQVGFSIVNQILYVNETASVWGGYAGSPIQSSYAATQNRVMLQVVRAANDIDLYTDANVLENRTNGVAYDTRSVGMGSVSGLQPASMNFYGGLALNRPATLAEVKGIKTYLGSKAGIAL